MAFHRLVKMLDERAYALVEDALLLIVIHDVVEIEVLRIVKEQWPVMG